MSIEIALRRPETKSRAKYPRVVSGEQFGILTRLMARIDGATIGPKLFLAYCAIHKSYYLDHRHTNGELRCPVCDEIWLADHNYAPPSSEEHRLRHLHH